MGLQDFVLWIDDPTISIRHARCKTCNNIITTDITTIWGHWNICTGQILLNELTEMKKMELWYIELRRLIWEEYGGQAELDVTDFKDWESYYEESLTPAEAIIEDLKNL